MSKPTQDAFSIGGDNFSAILGADYELLGGDAFSEILGDDEILGQETGEEFGGFSFKKLGKGIAKGVSGAGKLIEAPFKAIEKALPKELKPFARIIALPVTVSVAPLKFTGNVLLTGKLGSPGKDLGKFLKQSAKDAAKSGKIAYQNPYVRKAALGIAAAALAPVTGGTSIAAALAVEAAVAQAMKAPTTKAVTIAALDVMKRSAMNGDVSAQAALRKLVAAKTKRLTGGGKPTLMSQAFAKATLVTKKPAVKRSLFSSRISVNRGAPRALPMLRKPLARVAAVQQPAMNSMTPRQLLPLTKGSNPNDRQRAAALKLLPIAIARELHKVKFTKPHGTQKGYFVNSKGQIGKRRSWKVTGNKSDSAGWLVVGKNVSKGYFRKV
jgi:hypothetical protein